MFPPPGDERDDDFDVDDIREVTWSNKEFILVKSDVECAEMRFIVLNISTLDTRCIFYARAPVGCGGRSATARTSDALQRRRQLGRRGVFKARHRTHGDWSGESVESSMVWRQTGHGYVCQRRRLYFEISFGTVVTCVNKYQ